MADKSEALRRTRNLNGVAWPRRCAGVGRGQPLPYSATMDFLVLKEKLARIDKRLYVRDDVRRHVGGEFYSCPLYIRINKMDATKSNYSQLSPEAEQFLRGKEAGQFDEHICGVPWPWAPEFDVFDLDSGRELARGWRTIAQTLIRRGIAPKDKVRKVFGASIGETDWDRAGFEARKALRKKG